MGNHPSSFRIPLPEDNEPIEILEPHETVINTLNTGASGHAVSESVNKALQIFNEPHDTFINTLHTGANYPEVRRTGPDVSESVNRGLQIFNIYGDGKYIENLAFYLCESCNENPHVSTPVGSRYLQTIIKSLKIYYKNEYEWVEPLPNTDLKVSQSMHYVDPLIDVLNVDGFSVRYKSDSSASLLDPLPTDHGQTQTENRATQVLIRGDVGSGKTFLCKKVCYDWACEKQTFSSIPCAEMIPIFFSIKNLKPGCNLEDVLIDIIHTHTTKGNSDRESTIEMLKEYQGTLVIFLDGYNAIEESSKPEMTKILAHKKGEQQTIFRGSIFIVTSRMGTDINNEKRMFDRYCYISGLSEDNSLSLIKKFFSTHEFLDAQLINYLHELGFLKDEVSTPLLIILLCCVFEKVAANEAQILFEILHGIHDLLAERCVHRENVHIDNEEIWNIYDRFGNTIRNQNLRCHEALAKNLLQSSLGNDFNFITSCGMLKQLITRNSCKLAARHRILMQYLVFHCYKQDFPSIP